MTPVTPFLLGVEPRPAVLEFAMPDMAECERKGRALFTLATVPTARTVILISQT